MNWRISDPHGTSHRRQKREVNVGFVLLFSPRLGVYWGIYFMAAWRRIQKLDTSNSIHYILTGNDYSNRRKSLVYPPACCWSPNSSPALLSSGRNYIHLLSSTINRNIVAVPDESNIVPISVDIVKDKRGGNDRCSLGAKILINRLIILGNIVWYTQVIGNEWWFSDTLYLRVVVRDRMFDCWPWWRFGNHGILDIHWLQSLETIKG